MTVSDAERAPQRELQLRPSWLWGGYAVVCLLLAWGIDQPWVSLGPVSKVTRLRSGAFRYFLVHHDTGDARVRVAVEREGIRIVATGLRDAGLGIATPRDMLLIETPCPSQTPHRHVEQGDAQLVVAFEARRGSRPTSVILSTGGEGAYRYSPRLPLFADWREHRVALSAFGPGGASFFEVTFPHLMLAFHPPTAVDAQFRDLRILRVPAATSDANPNR